MRTRLGDSVSGRYRPEENSLLTKHVVAAGTFAKDAGSTPAASTISSPVPINIEVLTQLRRKLRLKFDLVLRKVIV